MSASAERESDSDGHFWRKLRHGLANTQLRLRGRLQAIVSQGVDEATLEDLEEALIEADLGVETTLQLVDALRADFKAARGDGLRLQERLADEISVLLMDAPQPPDRVDQPRITLIIGVNRDCIWFTLNIRLDVCACPAQAGTPPLIQRFISCTL